MLAKPKQNIRRGVVVVKLKNGSKQNALMSWDVTDEQAARESAAIAKLNNMRPDMDNFNSVVPGDRRTRKFSL